MAKLNQRQEFEIKNVTSAALEVTIEITPDRYVLRPGDKMVIEADLGGAPFTVNAYDGGMQIYAGWESECVVKINGEIVEPDWNTTI